jgi:hypothetical protein
MKIILSSKFFFQFYDMEILTNLREREKKKHSQIYMGKHMYPNFPTFFVRKRQKLFEKITQSNRS